MTLDSHICLTESHILSMAKPFHTKRFYGKRTWIIVPINVSKIVRQPGKYPLKKFL